MKYSLAFISALAAAAAAKPAFLNTAYQVVEGENFTLKYSGCDSGCTIVIQDGPSTNLKTVKTVTTGATGSSFTFKPEGLPTGTYAFKITDSKGEFNYSPQFSYQGTGTISSTSKESATASSTAKSTSAPSSTESASSTESESTATVSSTIGSTSTASETTLTKTTSNASSTTEAATTASSSAASKTSSAPPASTTIPNAGGRLSAPMGVAGAVAVMAFLN